MLHISWSDRDKPDHWRVWHIGEPIPEIDSPVVKFQADGDELNCLMSAMLASTGSHKSVLYTKRSGLHDRYRCTDCKTVCEERFNNGNGVYLCLNEDCSLYRKVQGVGK